jgi:hypothetical protein
METANITLADEEEYVSKLKIYNNKHRSNFTIFGSTKDFNYKYYMRWHKYMENPGHPSDMYVYSFTEAVESMLSISVGGYFIIIGLTLIFIILINIMWSLLYTIPGAKSFFDQNNFTSLFEVPTFVASLLYVEIWSYYRDISNRPLRIYMENTEWLKRVNASFNYAFKYEIESIKHFVRNNIGKMSTGTLKKWYSEFSTAVDMLTYYEFMLAVYTLRVYVPYDYDFEFLKTPYITKEKLNALYREVSKKKISEKMLSPEFVIDYIVKKIKEIIYLMPIQTTEDELPKLSISVQNEVISSINGLETNLRDSIINRSIPEQGLYIWTRNVFMVFWILVIIPFIAWNSVEEFLPLFGTIIMLMLAIPLINAWYVGKPFVHSGHYSGPNYFKWRRDVFKILEDDNRERLETLEQLKKQMNSAISSYNIRNSSSTSV